MLLHGILPPITTPFYPDGNVYHKKLEHNVERYSKTPVSGIVVLGSTGEAIMLSDEERRASTTAMAYYAIRKRMIEIHKEWMIRAYVVTLAFVTFRVFSDDGPTSHLKPPDHLFITLCWACWVVPLFIMKSFCSSGACGRRQRGCDH